MTTIGIDIGYRNLGFAVISLINPRRPILWGCEPVITKAGKPSEDDLFRAILAWCKRRRPLLDQATHITIEAQMQARFKIMNTVIRTLYPGKTLVVHPFTMAACYGLRHKRAEKKIDTMCWCRVLFDVPLPQGKQDDVADAALLALMGAGV